MRADPVLANRVGAHSQLVTDLPLNIAPGVCRAPDTLWFHAFAGKGATKGKPSRTLYRNRDMRPVRHPRPDATVTARGVHPRPQARVLVLPGGKVSSLAPSRSWQLSNVRVAALARSLRRCLGSDYLVRCVRYRYRGWNGTGADAVSDANAALLSAIAEDDQLDTYLVGHSMGGRVAAHLAAMHNIAGIVALAPWWPKRDAQRIPPSSRLLVVHGTDDRWTDPESSRQQVKLAQARGMDATWTGIPGAGHFMLTAPQLWNRYTADFLAESVVARHA